MSELVENPSIEFGGPKILQASKRKLKKTPKKVKPALTPEQLDERHAKRLASMAKARQRKLEKAMERKSAEILKVTHPIQDVFHIEVEKTAVKQPPDIDFVSTEQSGELHEGVDNLPVGRFLYKYTQPLPFQNSYCEPKISATVEFGKNDIFDRDFNETQSPFIYTAGEIMAQHEFPKRNSKPIVYGKNTLSENGVWSAPIDTVSLREVGKNQLNVSARPGPALEGYHSSNILNRPSFLRRNIFGNHQQVLPSTTQSHTF
jgi:hypothetical protein